MINSTTGVFDEKIKYKIFIDSVIVTCNLFHCRYTGLRICNGYPIHYKVSSLSNTSYGNNNVCYVAQIV